MKAIQHLHSLLSRQSPTATRTEKSHPLLTLWHMFAFSGLLCAAVPEIVHPYDLPPADPEGKLVEGPDGCLWGTTARGGTYDSGTVFKVDVVTVGGYSTRAVTLVKLFSGNDGYRPLGGLVNDGQGNLWGTTSSGGTYGFGSVFKIFASSGAFTKVFDFNGDNGAKPSGSLVLDSIGSKLWGTTQEGGISNKGTVFKLDPATGVLTRMIEFNGADGQKPVAGLTLDGLNRLWGTTNLGGSQNRGTLFGIGTNATPNSWSSLFHFDNEIGSNPTGEMIFDGAGNLWGTCRDGGRLAGSNDGEIKVNTITPIYGGGTIFRIDLSNYTVHQAHLFFRDSIAPSAPYTTAGRYPGGLVRDASGYLWGMTGEGGSNGLGTVFRFNPTNGTRETIRHFSGNTRDYLKGARGSAGMIRASNGLLWGITAGGGAQDIGTIFQIDPAILLPNPQSTVEFGEASTNAGLTADAEGNFWGTSIRRSHGDGTIYKVNRATGSITQVVKFSGGATNPASLGALIADPSGNFWGTSVNGGDNQKGAIFKLDPLTGNVTTMVSFTGTGGLVRGTSPQSRLLLDATGNFWGTTVLGGTGNNGTIFKYHPASGLTTVVDFSYLGATNKGSQPNGALVDDGAGNLWGTTSEGGTSGVATLGTVYKLNKSSGVLTTVAQFAGRGVANGGGLPSCELADDGNGNFWGSTFIGGASDLGTVFRINRATGVLTTVVEFSGLNGSRPLCGLTDDRKGGMWGTTSEGGPDGLGTVYRINKSSGILTREIIFSGSSSFASISSPFPRSNGSHGLFI